jgi:eukaryotic-like serine/threonine-protein kinase
VEGYTLHDVLGAGAHAEVHRAEAVGRPGRIVAVKRFTAAPTTATVREVRREADALERLSHPSIVRLLDVVTDGDGVALVTPYLPGGTLASRIARGPLPAAAVADLGARLGDALAAAHAAGVVHRDVKPTNVLYDAEEQPLLTDFGAAVLAGEDVTETVGTATYLDPEVVGGAASPGPASDQYALGVVLYEALAGSPPYAAPTVEATLRAADRGVHVPLGQHAPDAPPAIVTAIERAIRRDPTERFPTVRELASHLEEARSGLDTEVAGGTDATPDPVPGPPPAAGPGSSAGSAPESPPGSAPPLPTNRSAEPPTSPRRGRPAQAPAPTSDDPGLTRRFGPAPPAPAPEPTPERRRVPLLLAALAAVLVPIGVVLAFAFGGGDDPTITADPPTAASDPDATEPSEPTELPACEDAPALPPGNGDAVPADTTGSGCTVELGWDPDTQVLTVPQGDGEVLRYQLGEAGDVLLVGDWDCDGAQTPGLYRPSSGEVFLFDGFAGPGGELDSGPAQPTGAIGGDPVVVTGDDGCDRIEVPEDA